MFFSAVPAVVLSLLVSSLAPAGVSAAGPRPTCIETYKVSKGDTCSSIYSWSGVTTSTLQSLNPGFSCSSMTSMVGAYLCLRSFTPTCTLNVSATAASCAPLAAAYEITPAQFVQLNDDVDSACDNLVVGNPYCVSTADCFLGNTNPYCDGNAH